MGLLSRLSLKARLWFLFGAAVSVLFLITGIAAVNMESARHATMASLELADRLTVAVDTARGTQVQFRKQVKEWKDLLLRGTEPGLFDSYWSRFEAAEKSVAKGFAELREQFPVLGLETGKIDAAEQATKKLGEKARAAIATFDRTRPESAFEVDKQVRGVDHLGSDAIDGLVREIESRKAEMTKAIRQEVDESQARALAVSLACGLALTLVLALFSVVTIRSITTPLVETIAIFDSIRGGNLSTRVPADRRHEFGALWASLEAMQTTLRKNTDELKAMNEQLARNLAEIAALNEKAERLLLNILPAPIAARLKERQETIAEAYSEATVLFADLVGFTVFSQTVSPTELVQILNKIFSRFDKLADRFGLEKIKTIGDAYMACAGLPVPRPDHARVVADMAIALHGEMAAVSEEVGRKLQMRVGVNTGPVVAGVIGAKKFIYDLWGDAVNTASRMESHGVAGGVHVSESTWMLLRDDYEFLDRGVVTVKGKGEMRTFFLLGRKNAPELALAEAAAHAGSPGGHA
jgi:class 3 adenylate cyclase/HAMP domain-containing protein